MFSTLPESLWASIDGMTKETMKALQMVRSFEAKPVRSEQMRRLLAGETVAPEPRRAPIADRASNTRRVSNLIRTSNAERASNAGQTSSAGRTSTAGRANAGPASNTDQLSNTGRASSTNQGSIAATVLGKRPHTSPERGSPKTRPFQKLRRSDPEAGIPSKATPPTHQQKHEQVQSMSDQNRTQALAGPAPAAAASQNTAQLDKAGLGQVPRSGTVQTTVQIPKTYTSGYKGSLLKRPTVEKTSAQPADPAQARQPQPAQSQQPAHPAKFASRFHDTSLLTQRQGEQNKQRAPSRTTKPSVVRAQISLDDKKNKPGSRLTQPTAASALRANATAPLASRMHSLRGPARPGPVSKLPPISLAKVANASGNAANTSATSAANTSVANASTANISTANKSANSSHAHLPHTNISHTAAFRLGAQERDAVFGAHTQALADSTATIARHAGHGQHAGNGSFTASLKPHHLLNKMPTLLPPHKPPVAETIAPVRLHIKSPMVSTPVRTEPSFRGNRSEAEATPSIDYSNFSNFSYIADWAHTPELMRRTRDQQDVDTRSLFGKIQRVDVDAIFGAEMRRQGM